MREDKSNDQPNEFKLRLAIDKELYKILLRNGIVALLIVALVYLFVPTKSSVFGFVVVSLPLWQWLIPVIASFIIPFVILVGIDVYRKYTNLKKE